MTPAQATEALRNPVWHALTTRHIVFAERTGNMLRYRADILPFAAVQSPDTKLDAADILQHRTVYFCDVFPQITGSHFTTQVFPVPQMLYTGPLDPPAPLPNEEELTLEQSADMVDLTDAAFPGFFRPSTPLLGRYLGLRKESQLIAMAGERFRVPGLWEISAVCTRPGHTGKGFATHLMHRLMNSRADEQPFLHVVGSNTRAIELYERLGFVHLRTIDVLRVSPAV